MSAPEVPPAHRSWTKLTPEQHAVAVDLSARAHVLWIAADGELSLAEAVTLAAVQVGHTRPGATT